MADLFEFVNVTYLIHQRKESLLLTMNKYTNEYETKRELLMSTNKHEGDVVLDYRSRWKFMNMMMASKRKDDPSLGPIATFAYGRLLLPMN